MGTAHSVNSHAWVGFTSLDYHICKRRSAFSTYNSIEPLLVTPGGSAIGFGDVTLEIRKSNGEVATLVLNEVLHVPGAPCNAVKLMDIGTQFDFGARVAYDDDGCEVAYFPYQEGSLMTLKLAYGWSGLFEKPEKDDLPLPILLGFTVKGKPVLKTTSSVKTVLENVLTLQEYAEDGMTGADAYPRICPRTYLDQKVNLSIGDILSLLAEYDETLKTKTKLLRLGLLESQAPTTKASTMKDPIPMTPFLEALIPEYHTQKALTPKPFTTEPPTDDTPSMAQFIKNTWDSRPNFQHAHGLKMAPDDMAQGNRILEVFRQQGAFR